MKKHSTHGNHSILEPAAEQRILFLASGWFMLMEWMNEWNTEWMNGTTHDNSKNNVKRIPFTNAKAVVELRKFLQFNE